MTNPWTAPGTQSSEHASPSPAPATTGGPRTAASAAPDPEVVGLAPALGLFPLRPLSVGEILGAATRIYRARPGLVLGIAAAVMSVAGVLTVLLSGAALLPSLSIMQQAIENPNQQPSGRTNAIDALSTLTSSLTAGLLSGAATAVVTSALAAVTIGEATGRPLDSRSAWRVALRRGSIAALATFALGLLSVLLAAAIIAVGALPLLLGAPARWWSVVPLILAILAAIAVSLVIWARTALAIPVIAVEEVGPVRGLLRSVELTRGRRVWRVVGIALLIGVIEQFVSQSLSTITSLLGGVLMAILIAAIGGSTGFVVGIAVMGVIAVLGSYVAVVLVMPFAAAGITALYADLRMRTEAWDVELAAEARAGGGGHDRSR